MKLIRRSELYDIIINENLKLNEDIENVDYIVSKIHVEDESGNREKIKYFMKILRKKIQSYSRNHVIYNNLS